MDESTNLQFEVALLQEKFEVDPIDEAAGKVRILLLPRVEITLDFGAYPKRPEILIPKELVKMLGKPKDFLLGLAQWNSKKPFHVISIVEELRNYIENLSGIRLRILQQLAIQMCEQARQTHPREFLGLLRVKGGVLSEYVFPPGMQSSGTSAIYSAHRVPFDRSIIASIHSHPSSNARPSQTDLHMFSSGQNLFHLIIGFPYNLTTIHVYDRRGNEIPLEIVESTPYDLDADTHAVLDGFLGDS